MSEQWGRLIDKIIDQVFIGDYNWKNKALNIMFREGISEEDANAIINYLIQEYER